MVSEDDWIKSALSDDSAVADLLLLLHRSPAPPGPSPVRLDWSVRQRRSSKGALPTGSSDTPAPKKGSAAESTRASPTTPLSWSGATSSGGGGGFEASSLPDPKLRSNKVSSPVPGPSTKSTVKRLRKKKTLVELQEEENLLQKEQLSLRHELANLQVVIKEHRAMNVRLKKLKLDSQERQAINARECYASVSETEKAKSRETIFELPDLNLPVEDS